jgi:hypothetical protein
MNEIRPVPKIRGTLLGWMARLSSLAVTSVFVLILCLAVTNEDKPQGPAVTVLVLLALTVVVSFVAWRWPRVGGTLVVAGGLVLGVAAYSASQAFGLGASGLLSAFLYGAPWALVGILFWISGGRVANGSRE